MILYTMMPEQLIFPTDMNDFTKQKVISYEGIPLLVNMEEGQMCSVVRVMSSNPTDFLNNKFAPGTKITLN